MQQKEGPSTRSLHLRQRTDPGNRAMMPPIVVSAPLAYDDVGMWRPVALDQARGDICTRDTTPTTTASEQKVAAPEGAGAASFATGMATINTELFALSDPASARSASAMRAARLTFTSPRSSPALAWPARFARQWSATIARPGESSRP